MLVAATAFVIIVVLVFASHPSSDTDTAAVVVAPSSAWLSVGEVRRRGGRFKLFKLITPGSGVVVLDGSLIPELGIGVE